MTASKQPSAVIHAVGSKVWVRARNDEWVRAEVTRLDGDKLVVAVEGTGAQVTVASEDAPLQNNDTRGVEVSTAAWQAGSQGARGARLQRCARVARPPLAPPPRGGCGPACTPDLGWGEAYVQVGCGTGPRARSLPFAGPGGDVTGQQPHYLPPGGPGRTARRRVWSMRRGVAPQALNRRPRARPGRT